MKTMNKAVIGGGIAVVIIVVIVGTMFSNNFVNDSEKDNLTTFDLSFSTLITKDTPLKGDPLAPITIIEFGDFQCPNCGKFARDTSPQIEEAYVNSGQVNMAFKHSTVVGPDSAFAAMASQCANEQGKFWEFHDALYDNQGAANSGWVKKDNLKNLASDLGLDRNEFDSCLDENRFLSLVNDDLAMARELGFDGTPAFLIISNEDTTAVAITGAQPFSTFQKVLDEKINN